MSVTCRILAFEPPTGSGKKTGKTCAMGSMVIIGLHKRGIEGTKRLVISRTQDLVLNIGDTIKCLSGMALVTINPGTPAGVFILCPQIPFGEDFHSKYRTEIQINTETTKIVHRGEIKVSKDIGNIMRSTGATTR